MKTPTLLSQVRALNPGHVLMYSVSADQEGAIPAPIVIREEPLRGINATLKTTPEKQREAVLQVVETAELVAGHDTLVLKGKLLVRNTIDTPHSCNEAGYAEAHKAVIKTATEKGLVGTLAQRYALNLASANWAWRNALEADEITVTVKWKEAGVPHSVSFYNFLLSNTDTFNLDEPEYVDHKEAILKLGRAIEQALVRTRGFGTNFAVEARLHMGIGARVYPSQEWASDDAVKASKIRWPGGKGITRIRAKLAVDGKSHAIINDRKAGNALRVVDTWYSKGTPGTPIAVEPYGANAHQGRVFRGAKEDSIFGMVEAVCSGKPLTENQMLFYVASCVRGGVYGGKE
jgi:CRISPR-associated protein Csy3